MSDVALNRLANIDLFEGIAPHDLAEIEAACEFHPHKAGEEIFNRSTDNRDVFFVVAGRVRIVNYSVSGREVAYAEVPQGTYFGELSAIDGEPRSATIVALEDCLLGSLDQGTFLQVLRKHPESGLNVLQRMAGIIRACDERIMDLATLSAYQRVYRKLLDLMRPDPVRADSWLIYPLPTQAEIAAQASTTRETVARVLGQLGNEQIVERKGKTLYIRDKNKLEILAERTSPQGQSGGS
ncbi:MAG: Crp/Fnr family transcriptional regulator [Alphaproteobacteria bacterium]|nr:MAG: Crp/Fnr family transcriptional regulator [Alphaproteobacteria bacterium]